MARDPHFEEAKQFLRREEEEGNSLYDHLSRVLLKVIIDKPTDANKMFEEISSSVRRSTYVPPSLPVEGEETITPEAKAKQLAWTEAVGKLFTAPAEDENPEITYPDLMEEASVFAWAGVSFGEEETYRLYLAIKQLAMLEGLSLRFWGKVITRSGDYYIVQGESPEEPDDKDPKVLEGKEGPNKFNYWVCKFAGGPWTKLPICTPEMIVVARQIRRFFTGDLTAPVPSYPPFPGGTEAHLLRAQLAEITAKCSISPEGFYQEGEETDEGAKSIEAVDKETFVESYNPTLDNFKDLGFWKHHELLLNAIGRCQQIPANDDDEDAPEIEQPEPLPVNPSVTDPVVLGPDETPAWTLRTCPAAAGESPNSLVIATSQQWPGAFAAAYGKKYVNFYCGFGVAASTGAVYQPPKVPAIQAEWAPEGEDEGLVEQKDEITEPVAEADDEEEA